MYRPLNMWRLTQGFGENKACLPINGGKVIFCDGHNPPEGYRSVYGPLGHTGIDLYAPQGTPVYSAQRGVVKSIDTNEKSGFDVRIWSDVEGFKFLHIYEHLSKWNVSVGDTIETGQVIGLVGTTGYSSGPHLHFDCRDESGKPFDPIPHMYKDNASKIFVINKQLGTLTQAVKLLQLRIANFLSTTKNQK